MHNDSHTRAAPQRDSHNAELMLPWYINGSLNRADRSYIERWLLSSVEARTRLQIWQCVSQNTSNLVSEDAQRTADEHGAWLCVKHELSSNEYTTTDNGRTRVPNGPESKHTSAVLFFLVVCVAAFACAIAALIL